MGGAVAALIALGRAAKRRLADAAGPRRLRHGDQWPAVAPLRRGRRAERNPRLPGGDVRTAEPGSDASSDVLARDAARARPDRKARRDRRRHHQRRSAGRHLARTRFRRSICRSCVVWGTADPVLPFSQAEGCLRFPIASGGGCRPHADRGFVRPSHRPPEHGNMRRRKPALCKAAPASGCPYQWLTSGQSASRPINAQVHCAFGATL